ncbi:hypothetical protein R6Q59_007272 [Mikania micrantha]
MLSSRFKPTISDSSFFTLQVDSHKLFLLVYVDDIIITDWDGDKDNYRSTTVYVVYLGSNLFLGVVKDKLHWPSSTEAEFRAIASTTTEVQWIISFLTELGFHSLTMPTIYCDNLSAITYSANPFSSRMKTPGMDFHFVRERFNLDLSKYSFQA